MCLYTRVGRVGGKPNCEFILSCESLPTHFRTPRGRSVRRADSGGRLKFVVKLFHAVCRLIVQGTRAKADLAWDPEKKMDEADVS